MDGFAGLQRTGVKDLSFKMVFVASSVIASDQQRFSSFHKSSNWEQEEEDKEENLNQFSKAEQATVVHMKD